MISCVIPTFRRAAFLRRAINSVLEQTWPHLRVQVYDNASDDDTAEVVAELAASDSRIDYFRHERNVGAAANFHFATSRISTPLFSVLGDDDVILPDLYESAVSALARHPEAAFYCGRTATDDRLQQVFRRGQKTWSAGLHTPSETTVMHMIGDHFHSTGVVFRREIQDCVGLFGDYVSDKSYLIAASAAKPFVVGPDEQAVFTVHARSFSGGLSTEDRTAHDLDFVLNILREVEARLARTSFPALEHSALRARLLANSRREALYQTLFKLLPRGRWAAIDTLHDAAGELKFTIPENALIACLAMLRRFGATRWTTERVLAVTTAAFSRWLAVRDARPEFDARLSEYLASDCTDATLFD